MANEPVSTVNHETIGSKMRGYRASCTIRPIEPYNRCLGVRSGLTYPEFKAEYLHSISPIRLSLNVTRSADANPEKAAIAAF